MVPKPKVLSRGSATFTATLTSPYYLPGSWLNPWPVSYRLTWKGLTSAVVSAEIFFGKPGRVGRSTNTVPCTSLFGGPCASGRDDKSEMSDVNAKLVVKGAPIYVVLTTRKNPRGELRGQLKVDR